MSIRCFLNMTRLKKLRLIYDQGIEMGVNMDPIDTWTESIRIFDETETGGVVYRETKRSAQVWFIDMYCPGSMPSLSHFRKVFMKAKYQGCMFLAAILTNPRVEVLAKRLGFKKFEGNLWCLDL